MLEEKRKGKKIQWLGWTRLGDAGLECLKGERSGEDGEEEKGVPFLRRRMRLFDVYLI